MKYTFIRDCKGEFNYVFGPRLIPVKVRAGLFFME